MKPSAPRYTRETSRPLGVLTLQSHAAQPGNSAADSLASSTRRPSASTTSRNFSGHTLTPPALFNASAARAKPEVLPFSRQHSSRAPRLTVASAASSQASAGVTLRPRFPRPGTCQRRRATPTRPLHVSVLRSPWPLSPDPAAGGKSPLRLLRFHPQCPLVRQASQLLERVVHGPLAGVDPRPVGRVVDRPHHPGQHPLHLLAHRLHERTLRHLRRIAHGGLLPAALSTPAAPVYRTNPPCPEKRSRPRRACGRRVFDKNPSHVF